MNPTHNRLMPEHRPMPTYKTFKGGHWAAFAVAASHYTSLD